MTVPWLMPRAVHSARTDGRRSPARSTPRRI